MSKLFSHNLWNGISGLMVAGCSVFVAGYSVRVLGEVSSGLLLIANAALMILSAFGGFGFTTALVKEASGCGTDVALIKDIAGVALLFALGIGVAGCIITLLGAAQFLSFINYVDDVGAAKRFLLLYSLAFLLLQIALVFKAILQSRLELTSCAFADIGGAIFSAVGSFFALQFSKDLWILACIAIAASLMQLTFLGAVIYRKYRIVFWPIWCRDAFRRLWGFGRWIHVGTILGVVGDTLDKIVISSALGPASVPAYALARRFYSQANSLLASQVFFIFPKQASGVLLSKEEERVLSFLIINAAGFAYISIYFICPEVVGLIAGGDFAIKMKMPLLVFCFIGLIQSASLITYYSKMAEGFSGVVAITNAISGPGALITMYFLSVWFGLFGAYLGQLTLILGLLWLLGLKNRMVFNIEVFLNRSKLLISPLSCCAVCVMLSAAYPGYWFKLLLLIAYVMVAPRFGLVLTPAIKKDFFMVPYFRQKIDQVFGGVVIVRLFVGRALL